MNLNSCGVASVGPQLSVSETGEARNIRPGGANNRTSGSALLTGGARYAPPNAGPAVTSRGAKMPQWGIFRARLANPPAPTKRLWQKCCHSLFSLLYRRKSAPLSSDFQSAFYSVVQPFSDGWAFLFADFDRLPSSLRSDF